VSAYHTQQMERGRENYQRFQDEAQAQQERAQRRRCNVSERAPGGFMRRKPDQDALAREIKEANGKVHNALDVLRTADARESQLTQATEDSHQRARRRMPALDQRGGA